MTLFKIKDNDRTIPMTETHYYNWLKENNISDVHYTKTKVEYLTSQGFVVGTDRLSEEDLTTIKYIEQHYTKFNTIFEEMDELGL